MAEGDLHVSAKMEQSRFLPPPEPSSSKKYPISVKYCGECSMPIEYCEYYPLYEKCKLWLEKCLPEEFEKLMSAKLDDEKETDEDKKKRQTRGGKGMMKIKKKNEPQGIQLATSSRGKKKKMTLVMGLGTYDISLKDASKFFSSKFSCGSSVTAEDEIVIQGDVKDELFDIIPDKWAQISEDDIDDIGEVKK